VRFSFFPCSKYNAVTNFRSVPVHVHVFPGLPHGFRRFDDLPSSRRWDELVVEGIKWSLSDDTMTYGSELSLNVV